jgi:pimeloyl-ACP methyl ester carboxylesterase
MGVPMRPIATVLRLPDGRDLGYCEFGDPGGIPIIGFHGTPGSRLQLSPTPTSPLPAGYRLISPDRPGYGFSTFYKERRLIDWPRDVEALADHLELDRFAVLGISGGGPHVLVCAHALATRLIGVACVSGVGPLADPQATDGMLALNRWITTLSRRAPWLVRGLFRLQTRYLMRNPERALDMMTRQLPEADRKILSESEFRALLIDDFAHSSHTAPFAAAQDFQLFSRDWGFRLEDIPIRVHYWQGSVDRNVPAHHADLLVSRTPHATLHRYEGEGHFLIVPRLAEILQTIAPR